MYIIKKSPIITLLVIFMLLTNHTLCATTNNDRDTMPRSHPSAALKNIAYFKDGKRAWADFLIRNTRVDLAERNKAPVGNYRALVRFEIDTVGAIDTVVILQNPGYGTAEELVRVIKLSSGKWYPAISKNGQKTKMMMGQSMVFIVNKKQNPSDNSFRHQ